MRLVNSNRGSRVFLRFFDQPTSTNAPVSQKRLDVVLKIMMTEFYPQEQNKPDVRFRLGGDYAKPGGKAKSLGKDS